MPGEAETIPGPGAIDMFTTYAVRISDGLRSRAVVGRYASEDDARSMACRVVVGDAQYAYVRAPTGATVFYLQTPYAAYLVRDPDKIQLRALSPFCPEDDSAKR